MLIREFKNGDEEALWEVFHNAVHQTAAADYSPEQVEAWSPAQPDLDRWALRMQGIRPFVVDQDGKVVAYADVQDTGYIDHFYVSPTVGRRGVGALLMQKIHEMAMGRHVPALFSNVSLTARPFFEKWGFVVEASQTVTVRGVSMNNFRMRKPLGEHT